LVRHSSRGCVRPDREPGRPLGDRRH
jgi:hypothetical protein